MSSKPTFANDISKLPHKAAGKTMLTFEHIPCVEADQPLSSVEHLLTTKAKGLDALHYIYVIDKHNILQGVISFKELFHLPKSTLISEVMQTEIISARLHTPQERVAHLALEHSLKEIPVVSKDNELLGVVSGDTILNTLYLEAREDILHLSGIHTSLHNQTAVDDIFKLSIWQALKHRLPWLLVGLGGGVLAARIISIFETTLSQNIILATFIPLIVYMSDAVGTQMEAFTIRDFAIKRDFKFIKYFWRQLLIVGSIAVITSAILWTVAAMLYDNFSIASVLSIAMFVAIVSSVFTGVIIPYLFSRLKLDPANASGPIATIIQDIISILVYFLAAQIML